MTEPAPLPPPASSNSGAFLAAIASLGLVAIGIHLDPAAGLVRVATVLAAFAAPCWLAIGLHLSARPPGNATRRARALLVLAVASATLLLVAAVALLLFAAHLPAAVAFVAACLLAGLALERAA